jgi:aspartate aminotransferase-like enzyme
LECSSPAVLNIELPSYIKSLALGQLLEENGFILSYMSEYLRKRNWIQICIMGDMQEESIKNLMVVLEKNMKNNKNCRQC